MTAIGPGSLVKCVGKLKAAYDEALPVVGRIYRVRTVEASEGAIRLAEIVNPSRPYRNGVGECFFELSAFIPIRDDALDVFRTVERDAPTPVEA